MRLGFDDVGIVRAEPSEHEAALERWLEKGRHGSMEWMADDEAVARRLSGVAGWGRARSVVVVAHDYFQEDAPGVPEDPSKAVIAHYARGRDYHKTVRAKLGALSRWVRSEVDEDVWGRAYVDTGPLLERELGHRAGLGWFGRNTMLINPKRGSYFFLGALLLDLELPPDPPFAFDHCGTCRACLDACPTDALLGRDESGAPVLDANRCISYLTIEHRGAITEALRGPMGNRVYGCDICQECCPWTVKFGPEQEVRPEYEAVAWPADRDGDPPLPSLDGPDLVAFTERILEMSGKEYGRVFAESPLARPGRKGMLRNLCVALGNYGATSAEAAERVRPLLEKAAADASELVREHAEWGLEVTRAEAGWKEDGMGRSEIQPP
jgi:epoxyqueuosine reductase